jgi:hypothetical protein
VSIEPSENSSLELAVVTGRIILVIIAIAPQDTVFPDDEVGAAATIPPHGRIKAHPVSRIKPPGLADAWVEVNR